MKNLLDLKTIKILSKKEQSTILGQRYRGCEPLEPCEFDYITCSCTE